MPTVKIINEDLKIETQREAVRGMLINSGVPHFVVDINPDAELAKELRKAKELSPEGANITFISYDGTETMGAITFERGVEGFTLACGTGAIAAAAFYKNKIKNENKQFIDMPGGLFEIIWNAENKPNMTSHAQFDFDFYLYEDEI